MLDPELIRGLAAAPEKNAPEVNRALAEEGDGLVLLSLAQSAATASDALDVIGSRLSEGRALDPPLEPDEDPRSPSVAEELERLLVAHANASAGLRDQLLAAHLDDPFFVLAAAAHPRATLAAVERAGLWPRRFPVLDGRWLRLIPPAVLPPLTAQAWAQADDPRLREVVAQLSEDDALLARLAADPRREVRRAVASNPRAEAQRRQLAETDPAPEVRARARGDLGDHEAGAHGVSSARFAAGLRAMEAGGALAPDTAAALARAEELDDEGALLAPQVLPPDAVLELIRHAAAQTEATTSTASLAAGFALRAPDDDEIFRDLVADATKALSESPLREGNLTGKARLAAWLAEGLACCPALDRDALLTALPLHALAAELAVLGRSAASAPELATCMCRAAREAGDLPPALLELVWRSREVSDEEVVSFASRVAKAKRRGQDLPDDEIDLDPNLRSVEVLERVVLAASRHVTFTPRSALPVIALDSRRVRYVLTALPSWRGELRGSMLARVLRQRAGALSAARSESRSRGSEIRDWTARVMTDTELGLAIAVGHFTCDALVHRIGQGRHHLEDGVTVAAGVETRAVLEGTDSVRSLIRWAGRERSASGGALALWLLLEHHDRFRPTGQIASAVDTLAHRIGKVSLTVAEALATLERREPGRLEGVFPQTPKGRATLASAIARAYRALGGLRAER
ncbi:MAG: hypothetical protein KC731_31395 [Myxococcales bacterium]|nr:hypothetical protein [Myxococcales bacterium]